MVKASTEPLKPNPFTTYRDPITGLWVVVKTPNSSPEDLMKVGVKKVI